MQTIDPEIIYELTPEGHDVLQHRSLQLPMELRFLLMLVNGSRTVGTLRVVTPAAKQDDAGFIILQEYGLIRAMNGLTTDAPLKAEPAVQAVAAHEEYMGNDQPDLIEPSPVLPVMEAYENAFAEPSIFGNAEAEITNIMDQEAAELFAFEPETYATENLVVPAPVAQPPNALPKNVSPDDRQAVEIILKRALKQDAKFVIDQLSQKQTYSDFLPAVKRLETAIRETVSTIEADALRNRFSEAF
jgi:hypothetical protein